MRRFVVASLVAALLVLGATACGESGSAAQATPATAAKQDVKTLAASLQTRTVAAIDAMNSRNEANISRAKTDLTREADRVEDALKSETGAAANRANAAIGRIRTALIANDVRQLEQARDLLQQAQQS